MDNRSLLFEIAAFLKITFQDKLLTMQHAEEEAKDLLNKIGKVLSERD